MYPNDQPQAETLPIASPRASSGKNAAAMFSPVPKKTFDNTISANASAKSPGPTKDKSAVPSTQPEVVIASSFFFAA